jgi:nucleotide-binding universal stress UspA family protein
MSEAKITRILLPIDGSDASLKAVRYAIKLAKSEGAEIVCIHTVGTPPYAGYKGSGPLIKEFIEEAKRHSEKWFEDVKVLAKSNGVKVKTEILTDVVNIPDAIVDHADKTKSDLIVIGTRGRSAVKRFLLGSVAQGVVAHAHCPVLVVR